MLNIKTTPATIEIANKQNRAQAEIAKIDLNYLKHENEAYGKRAYALANKAVELGFVYDFDEAVELAYDTMGSFGEEDFEDEINGAFCAENQAVDVLEHARNFLPEGSEVLVMMEEQVRIAEEIRTITMDMCDQLAEIGNSKLECLYYELLIADAAEDIEEDAEAICENILEGLKSFLKI